jgi:RNA polymerase sigma factor (TIGR02999 family)
MVTLKDAIFPVEDFDQKAGDQDVSEQLLPMVYHELRKLAASRLAKEKLGHSLQPTMLVHEAYLRLVDVDQPQRWNGRGHFFAAAAEAMRRIVVENARRKRSQKRGGEMHRVELDLENATAQGSNDDLLSLDEALTEMEQLWPDKAQLVKLRYFAGLTNAEACEAMGVSTSTGERYWNFARAWLHSQLNPED